MRGRARRLYRDHIPETHLLRQHRIRHDLNLELIDVTYSTKLRHMSEYLPYIELGHELGEIPHLPHDILPERRHCHPVYGQGAVNRDEVKITTEHSRIDLHELGARHLRQIPHDPEFLLLVVELLGIQHDPRREGRDPHCADVLGNGLEPVDSKPSARSYLCSSSSTLADSSEHLLINPGDPLTEGLHCLQIIHMRPCDVCHRDLIEEFCD